MVPVGNPYLRAALRRLRLQSAVARAEQSGALRPEELASLASQLHEARVAEQTARAEGGGELPIDQLTRRLELRPLDEQILLSAVALEADPLFAITVSALGGEEPRLGLTAKLLAQVFGFAGDETLDLGLGPSHPLVSSCLLESGAAPTGLVETLRPWRAASRTLSYLSGLDELDPVLARCGELVVPPEGVDLGHVQRTLEVLDRVVAQNENVIVLVEGPEGSGRRTAIGVAAQRYHREVVTIDAGRLSSDPGRFSAELRALRRECWLRGAVPVVARIDALTQRDGRLAERFAEVADALESPGCVLGPAFVTAASGEQLPDFWRRVVRLRMDPPGPGAREKLWLQALGGLPVDAPSGEGIKPLGAIAHRFTMTPGVIRRSAANARMFAQGRPLTVDDVFAGVSTEVHERFSSLAVRLRVNHRWEDLVLPADTYDDVRSFASRAEHAAKVYDQWGFRTKLQRGLGLAALFSGPPGTGKTMVAGLIARALSLDLYMVDLSQVVSKWVGETEKQLAKIFDAAAMGQALLLFDEADALFSKRTEVKSSNDRYANLEVNFLLQRLEEFPGVAILTTNLEGSVDPAFKRRLAAEVKFYPPEKDERERLWRTLLPTQAPAEPDLDFAELAEKYKEMCGGHIRNAVLRAAFLAATEGAPISQEMMQRAARIEYKSMGKVV